VSSLCCLVVAEDAQVRGEISGVGVIVAEDAAATRKSVLGQHPRSVQIAQRDQVNGEAVGRAGGVVVVVAQNAPPPHQRVLVQAPGGLRIAKVVRVPGEAVSRSQGVGMIVAESAATPGQGVLIHTAGFVVALAAIVLRRQNSWPLVCRVEVCSPLMRLGDPGGIEADVQIVGQVQGRAGCSRMEGAGRPACTSRSVLLLRGWLGGVARDGQVEQDHGVVVGGAGLG